jgi:hypothetical protein
MRSFIALVFTVFIWQNSYCQTDFDGLFMSRNNLCVGLLGSYSSFTHYWEGVNKRDNLNMGTVSNTSVGIMGNYGISDRWNLIFNLPYVQTNASAGNMQGQKGLQDLSFWLKYAIIQKRVLNGDLQVIPAIGYSMPTRYYTPDVLPLSIGLQSRVWSYRMMVDYEKNHWYFTGGATYMHRQNIFLERNTYYTDRQIYSNEVIMPNVLLWNVRFGYRNQYFIADVFYENMNTIGGFDIARNAMPFPSNNMEYQRMGIYFKYETPVNGLSILANGFTTFAGRNMGQWSGIGLGAFYIIDMTKKYR